MIRNFIDRIKEVFACLMHVILILNVEDRLYCPEMGIGPTSLPYFLASVFSKDGYRTAIYAPSQGVSELVPDTGQCQAIKGINGQGDPVAVFNGLRRLMQNPSEKWIILVNYPEHLAPGNENGMGSSGEGNGFSEIMHSLARDPRIASGECRLILITYSGMPDGLLVNSPAYRVIEVPLPDYKGRLGFIKFLIGSAGQNKPLLGTMDKNLSPEEMARQTKGMPLIEIEALFRASKHHGRPISNRHIRRAKAAALQKLGRERLRIAEPQLGLESIAGLRTVKAFFYDLVDRIKKGHTDLPQAILFEGVPGVAKSASVMALAAELRWVHVMPGALRGPYVGQSEQFVEHFISLVEQLLPVVLFFDEIDQILGQRGVGVSGDSGTSERILARLFEWLGQLHLRGKILIMAATNRPDILDPAILDRFGVSIPFIRPGSDEVAELIPMMLARFNRTMSQADIESAQESLSGLMLSGRSFQEILLAAGRFADKEAGSFGSQIRHKHIALAAANHIEREDPVELEFLELTALSLASSQDLLPWNDETGLREGAEVPERFLGLGVVESDGRLNSARLHQVLNELKVQRFNQKMMR